MLLKPLILALLPITAVAGSITGTGTHTITDNEPIDVACQIAEIKAYKDIAIKVHGGVVESNFTNICKEVTPSLSKQDLTSCASRAVTSVYHNGHVKSVISKNTDRSKNMCSVQITAITGQNNYIKASIRGKEDYMHGEGVKFFLKVDTPVYVYIFLQHGRHTEMIYPRNPSDFIFTESGGQLPEYRVWLDNGKTREHRKFIVLLSKQQVDFSNRMLKHTTYEEVINHLPAGSRRIIEKDVFVIR
jgi:hypothetical protein